MTLNWGLSEDRGQQKAWQRVVAVTEPNSQVFQPHHSCDHDVQKMLEKVQGEFKEYQLALYIYGFAYFLEVMLQENYEKAYLSAIAKRIDEICFIPLIRL